MIKNKGQYNSNKILHMNNIETNLSLKYIIFYGIWTQTKVKKLHDNSQIQE